MSNRNGGFTLIEMMIVVVIIGILAAIAVPNFIAMQDRIKESEVKSIAHCVQLAVEDYFIQNDASYPQSIKEIVHMLPEGSFQENPFTGELTEPRDGTATMPGQVSYQPQRRDGINVGYTIIGFGKHREVVVLTSGF